MCSTAAEAEKYLPGLAKRTEARYQSDHSTVMSNTRDDCCKCGFTCVVTVKQPSDKTYLEATLSHDTLDLLLRNERT